MIRETHNIPPVYNEDSRILILGSFPSRKSREDAFFYAHPRNRFWQIIARICDEAVPITADEKRSLLLTHGIALWDVCAVCDIHASSDASIKNVVANDIPRLLAQTKVTHVFTNGMTADKLYTKLIFPTAKIPAIRLPSTSPANASQTLATLSMQWQILQEFII